MRVIDDMNTEVGCYAEGHRGWTALPHIIQTFAHETETEAHEAAHHYIMGDNTDEDHLDIIEYIAELSDEIEVAINEALPHNRVAFWHDGEFFISAWCGQDHFDRRARIADDGCNDEECACRMHM